MHAIRTCFQSPVIPKKYFGAPRAQKVIAASLPVFRSAARFRNFSSNFKKPIFQPDKAIFDPRVKTLSDLVLLHNDYAGALVFALKQKIPPNGHDEEGNSLLSLAAARNNIDALLFALDYLQTPPNLECRFGTSLHLAVENYHLYATRILLQKEASPFVVNAKGETPLDLARRLQRRPLIDLLERFGS